MSTTKRISGTYTIQTLNPTDQINLDSPFVVVNGNLIVTGNSQSIVSTNSEIANNVIVLNNGSTVPNPLGANIMVDRGSSANVSIRWNEAVASWQLTNNGLTYSNILATGSGGITSVSADPTPALGGNLNISNHSIYSNVSGVQIWSTTAPGGGGTGVTVTNATYANVELMSKTKSIVYSIIFG
jgi:hypothetical protein